MKTVLAVVVTIVAMVVVAHAALTFRGPRHWAGMEHPMMMQIGPHMMGQGAGPTGPGMHRGAMPATQVGEDEAKAIAWKYVDEQLKGYTIANVTPSTGMPNDVHRRAEGPDGRRQDAPHQPVRPRDAVPSAGAPGVVSYPTALPRRDPQ